MGMMAVAKRNLSRTRPHNGSAPVFCCTWPFSFMRSFGKTGYLFIFILKASPDGISHALVHHTLVIWEALRASLIYWVPVPFPVISRQMKV